MTAFYISLGITLAICLAELIFAFFYKEKLRMIFKPLCLAGIIVTVCFINKSQSPFIYLALGFGLLGDIFLIKEKDEKFFVLGIASFFIGHIFYIIAMAFASSVTIPFWVYIIFGVVILGAPFVVPHIMPFKMGKASIIGPMYAIQLVCAATMAVILLINNNSTYRALPLIGMILFLISDSILTYTHFMKPMPRREAVIMVTYLSAQMLLAFGLAFLLS